MKGESRRGSFSLFTIMSLSKDLIVLILQFCNEENLLKTAHMLEQETGIFFDMKHFEDIILGGFWEEAEKYLSSFTGVEDNKYSIKIYFEIRKQKFLEALDRDDRRLALDILLKDLKVFAATNEELYREMALLLTLDDFRDHSSLSSYGDTMSARKCLVIELKAIIEANPQFHGRLNFPQLGKSRLRRLVNQSLNWQHIHCANPQQEPQIKTLFTDHKCPEPDQSSKEFQMPRKTISISTPPFPCAAIISDRTTSDQVVRDETLTRFGSTFEDVNDSGSVITITSTEAFNEKVSPCPPSQCLSDNFPKDVERFLNLGSSPTSMDFHPIQQILLLVGNSVGDVELWDVGAVKKLFWRKFTVWKTETVSASFLEDINKNPHISVNRVLWSSDGSLFGAAYSRNIVQLYSYHGGSNSIRKQLEIEAHAGSVNDLAFSKPYNQLLVITCGDDKLIQVWDAVTGARRYTFEGHQAAVYSLCPREKEKIHFLFSTSNNGEIKAWLFDNMGPRVQYDAPGHSCMRMVYSADGKRLFSCGTNKDGDSYIVEWNETEGYITRVYSGLSKCFSGILQFDISSNGLLAAGDDHLIKVWNADNDQILTVIDAGGDLTGSPCIRFNKKGNMLAISADHNKIKILVNEYGRNLLQTSSGHLSESTQKAKLNESPHEKITDIPVVVEPGVHVEPSSILGALNISKVVEVSQCKSLRLPSEVKTDRIWRLTYTSSGNAIMALAADGVHLVWKWSKNDINLGGQATTKCVPEKQPRSGLLMVNSSPPSSNSDMVSPCLALSKNDSYAISASGGMVSLFNVIAFKKMKSFMPPAPAATCIAFYPSDNNIIAVGLEDSTIIIYNVRLDEVVSKLEGHLKGISCIAFSNALNVLISSGIDAQIVVWDCNKWEKQRSAVLQISPDWSPTELSETIIQFHQDQKRFLAVHETQLSIYEACTLHCVKQWTMRNFCTRICHATFSCNNQFVYAVMRDGIVLILDASHLCPRFEIDPSTYIPSDIRWNGVPLVIAAHPGKPNQFALGLSDGGVLVVEPQKSEDEWVDDNTEITAKL
ncbi:protein TOPLESS-like isoform X2 [Ipomoea triloba]|uniref:protein TOPLESS-like isoform X2 n=1 Tax=Ipomoea triloba TaxID=35885 RepID=UPI00125D2A57|nr:protein TOPLESS-like isoform X2 [Ipomoea triloba]